MPIILPDARKKQVSVIDMNKAFGEMSKGEYENGGNDQLMQESLLICGKHLIMAVQNNSPESVVQVIKQMFQLMEMNDE